MNQLVPQEPVFPVAGRNCDDCTMCCKLGAIEELNKPDGEWCPDCIPGKGCGVYETRPQICRGFHCFFLLSDLSEEWRPSHCKFMVSTLMDGAVAISVDAARPDAWKKEPYFSMIRQWSKEATRVVVFVGLRAIAVYPEKIEELGIIDDEHGLTVVSEQTPNGERKRTIRVNKKEFRGQV